MRNLIEPPRYFPLIDVRPAYVENVEGLQKLLAEAMEGLKDASAAVTESLRYIDGNPPHRHLPNLDWLAAVERQTRLLLARIEGRLK